MTTATVKEQVAGIVNKLTDIGEDALRAEIAALDKKIKNKKAHIERLTTELAEQVAERLRLKRERIKLLETDMEADSAVLPQEQK